MTVTHEERLSLIRLPGLISRHRVVLSDFEAKLVDEVIDRYRTRGDRMTLTVNERLVLADAYEALDKAARGTAGRAAA
jgi:hypothetical protein